MKFISGTILLVLSILEAKCQLNIGIEFNYPVSLSQKTVIYDEFVLNDSLFSSVITKDNFTNISFPIFLEAKLSKKIFCRIEYKYLTNNYNIEYFRTTSSFRKYSEKFKLHNLTFQFITNNSLSESSALSVGMGIIVLFNGDYIRETKLVYITPDDIEINYYKGTSLGFKTSIFYSTKLNNRISLFSSLNLELASWQPKEYEFKKFILQGDDKLPTLPANYIKGKVGNECNLQNINSNFGCRLSEFLNYERFSISLGIKYRLL